MVDECPAVDLAEAPMRQHELVVPLLQPVDDTFQAPCAGLELADIHGIAVQKQLDVTPQPWRRLDGNAHVAAGYLIRCAGEHRQLQ